MSWQVQEAPQRFGEILQQARECGPQMVSERGEDVAVVISIEEYRRLRNEGPDFKEFLMSGPDLSVLDLTRDTDPPRDIDL